MNKLSTIVLTTFTQLIGKEPATCAVWPFIVNVYDLSLNRYEATQIGASKW